MNHANERLVLLVDRVLHRDSWVVRECVGRYRDCILETFVKDTMTQDVSPGKRAIPRSD